MKTKEFITVGAGRLKGRKILLPQVETTRVTKSIARDSVFDTLQSEIANYAFVEVFAGSGSVGIEAYSRGSDAICFLEQSKKAYETLQKNIKDLSIKNTFCLFGDSFENIHQIQHYLLHQNLKAWFYIDPPFDIRSNYEDIYKKTSDLIENLDKNCTRGVIVEHRSDARLSDLMGEFELYKRKKFGKTTLSYYI